MPPSSSLANGDAGGGDDRGDDGDEEGMMKVSRSSSSSSRSRSRCSVSLTDDNTARAYFTSLYPSFHALMTLEPTASTPP